MHNPSHITTKVVKKSGGIEYFDSEKLELTVIRATLNAHLSDEEGREIARKVLSKIASWLQGKDEISSGEIFIQVIDILGEINKDISFMYKTHRDIS